MLQPPPAEPGMREEEVDTPALILDLDAFEANLDAMAALLAPTGAKLRAHAKTHKSAVIAKLQMARGAVGQCVQKVAEAEALAWGGIPDILVSNQVVGARKLNRLMALARIANVAVCADDAEQVAAIAAAAEAAGVRIPVLVEIDCGAARCGVAPGPAAVALAEAIAGSHHLRFGGLQSYQGSAQHKRAPEEREAAIGHAAEVTRRTVEQLRQRGLDCPIVGGGGTGTFALEAASGVYTEIQAGSYTFMDADYARNQVPPPFRHSLFVLATVMSRAIPGVAVVDAGHKAVSVDSGLPQVWQRPSLRYVGASDEHGKLLVEDGEAPALGEKLRLVPGHCDPTVDRYDWYVGVRGGRVECLWPIAARGGMA
ncbi:DSD1 family PLP-dependent enzyme [Siccirubricoccus sp. KC 17139]|uniref:DSD1 family PLP-dependent enzyme n=1 Tax=Siccirubricoccus soli TaxID=2899147 RepID=A0ABT1D4G7_9PROT|nr:DSD1 family PLP-dependent enzyme [Siccirubricoccus soli]MCO6416823.1 DSD1 family PLP-dependent enzyme [Siccirubricoccus soli]MCP2682958.1 DSD1 family PLP-dependent enzyme [Siccirubricoccus soli]